MDSLRCNEIPWSVQIMKIHLITYVLMVFLKLNLEQMYNEHTIILMYVVSETTKPAEVPTAVTDGIAYIEGKNVNYVKDQIQAILKFVS